MDIQLRIQKRLMESRIEKRNADLKILVQKRLEESRVNIQMVEISEDDEGPIEVSFYKTEDDTEYYKSKAGNRLLRIQGKWHICTPDGKSARPVTREVVVKESKM